MSMSMSTKPSVDSAPKSIDLKRVLPETIQKLVDKQLIVVNQRTIQFGPALTLTLADIRLPHKKEDDIYAHHRDVWLAVPRGLCFAIADNKVVFVLSGLRKFGYEADRGMSLTDKQVVEEEVFTTKENGEAFHLSAFEHNKTVFLLFGSKNVHAAVRYASWQDDLKLYTEQRYEFVHYMARAFFLEEMNQLSKFSGARDFLLRTGFTFVGESCRTDSSHLVKYAKNQTLFFAMTRYDVGVVDAKSSTSPEPASLCAMNPQAAQLKFQELGLSGVSECISVASDQTTQRANLRSKIELSKNCEGAVVYCMTGYASASIDNTPSLASEEQKNKDKNKDVVRIYKLKNYDYIFWRAVRERMRRHTPTRDILKRLSELHIEHPDAEKLTVKAAQFNAFAQQRFTQEEKKSAKTPTWSDWLSNRWTSLMDAFDAVTEEERQKLLAAQREGELKLDVAQQQANGNQLQLLPIAIPGCGKTTLLRAVMKLLGGQYLDQDMCDGNPKKYHEKATLLSKDKKVPAIGLGKCNHTAKIRREGVQALNPLQQVVFLPFVAPAPPGCNEDERKKDDSSRMLREALARIEKRGTHHACLHPSDKLGGILSNFSKTFEPLTESEREQLSPTAVVIPVNMLASKVEMVAHVMEQLRAKQLLNNPSSSNVDAKAIADAVAFAEAEETRCAPSKSWGHGGGPKNNEGKDGSKSKAKTTLYWGVELPVAERQRVLDHPTVKSVLEKHADKKVNPVLHSTMLFVGTKEGVDESKCLEICSWNVPLTVTKVVHDAKAVALVLQKDFPCENETAHITLALASGVKPFYSNQMINSVADAVHTPLNVSSGGADDAGGAATANKLVLSGVVKRFT